MPDPIGFKNRAFISYLLGPDGPLRFVRKGTFHAYAFGKTFN
jgi:hypothetical protein